MQTSSDNGSSMATMERKGSDSSSNSSSSSSSSDDLDLTAASPDDWDRGEYEERVAGWYFDQYLPRCAALVGDGQRPGPLHVRAGVDTDLLCPSYIWDRLLPFQRYALLWFDRLRRRRQGGILADEMGLGKTVQVLSFLACSHYTRHRTQTNSARGGPDLRRAFADQCSVQTDGMLPQTGRPHLIVVPTTLLGQWVEEARNWYPLFRVMVYHSSVHSEPGVLRRLLSKASAAAGTPLRLEGHRRQYLGSCLVAGETPVIVVTSYGSLRSKVDQLLAVDWDAVVLDEGHRIRNPKALVSAAAKRLKARQRYVMSGSPAQNALKELWSIMDFVCPRKLGTLPLFEQEFCWPIAKGGYSNASYLHVSMAYERACALRALIKENLLRRTKSDVSTVINCAQHATQLVSQDMQGDNRLFLPQKKETVLFCRMSSHQYSLYERYLQSDEVQDIIRARHARDAADSDSDEPGGGRSSISSSYNSSDFYKYGRRRQRSLFTGSKRRDSQLGQRARSFRIITRLRHLCNHPDLWLLENRGLHEGGEGLGRNPRTYRACRTNCGVCQPCLASLRRGTRLSASKMAECSSGMVMRYVIPATGESRSLRQWYQSLAESLEEEEGKDGAETMRKVILSCLDSYRQLTPASQVLCNAHQALPAYVHAPLPSHVSGRVLETWAVAARGMTTDQPSWRRGMTPSFGDAAPGYTETNYRTSKAQQSNMTSHRPNSRAVQSAGTGGRANASQRAGASGELGGAIKTLKNVFRGGYGDPYRSGKLVILRQVLRAWYAAGHRVLIFSQNRQTLDVLEKFMVCEYLYITDGGKPLGWATAWTPGGLSGQHWPASVAFPLLYSRMDGQTAVKLRAQIVKQFNGVASSKPFAQTPDAATTTATVPWNSLCFCLLLTTKVGGLGLNLTGANRVVIYDPDWNPSTDAQARERVYRIGQSRNVLIYRLVLRGTIEEKMYHRQVFKQLMTQRVLVSAHQKRLFSKQHMRNLFVLTAPAPLDSHGAAQTPAGGTADDSSAASHRAEASPFDARSPCWYHRVAGCAGTDTPHSSFASWSQQGYPFSVGVFAQIGMAAPIHNYRRSSDRQHQLVFRPDEHRRRARPRHGLRRHRKRGMRNRIPGVDPPPKHTVSSPAQTAGALEPTAQSSRQPSPPVLVQEPSAQEKAAAEAQQAERALKGSDNLLDVILQPVLQGEAGASAAAEAVKPAPSSSKKGTAEERAAAQAVQERRRELQRAQDQAKVAALEAMLANQVAQEAPTEGELKDLGLDQGVAASMLVAGGGDQSEWSEEEEEGEEEEEEKEEKDCIRLTASGRKMDDVQERSQQEQGSSRGDGQPQTPSEAHNRHGSRPPQTQAQRTTTPPDRRRNPALAATAVTKPAPVVRSLKGLLLARKADAGGATAVPSAGPERDLYEQVYQQQVSAQSGPPEGTRQPRGPGGRTRTPTGPATKKRKVGGVAGSAAVVRSKASPGTRAAAKTSSASASTPSKSPAKPAPPGLEMLRVLLDSHISHDRLLESEAADTLRRRQRPGPRQHRTHTRRGGSMYGTQTHRRQYIDGVAQRAAATAIRKLFTQARPAAQDRHARPARGSGSTRSPQQSAGGPPRAVGMAGESPRASGSLLNSGIQTAGLTGSRRMLALLRQRQAARETPDGPVSAMQTHPARRPTPPQAAGGVGGQATGRTAAGGWKDKQTQARTGRYVQMAAAILRTLRRPGREHTRTPSVVSSGGMASGGMASGRPDSPIVLDDSPTEAKQSPSAAAGVTTETLREACHSFLQTAEDEVVFQQILRKLATNPNSQQAPSASATDRTAEIPPGQAASHPASSNSNTTPASMSAARSRWRAVAAHVRPSPHTQQEVVVKVEGSADVQRRHRNGRPQVAFGRHRVRSARLSQRDKERLERQEKTSLRGEMMQDALSGFRRAVDRKRGRQPAAVWVLRTEYVNRSEK